MAKTAQNSETCRSSLFHNPRIPERKGGVPHKHSMLRPLGPCQSSQIFTFTSTRNKELCIERALCRRVGPTVQRRTRRSRGGKGQALARSKCHSRCSTFAQEKCDVARNERGCNAGSRVAGQKSDRVEWAGFSERSVARGNGAVKQGLL